MKLPNAQKAHVPEAKVRDYLLSTSHPIGRFKARYFSGLGYSIENWQELRRQLLGLAFREAEPGEATDHGRKYVISGLLPGPKAAGEVVTVWIVPAEDDAPRLVTVYPR